MRKETADFYGGLFLGGLAGIEALAAVKTQGVIAIGFAVFSGVLAIMAVGYAVRANLSKGC